MPNFPARYFCFWGGFFLTVQAILALSYSLHWSEPHFIWDSISDEALTALPIFAWFWCDVKHGIYLPKKPRIVYKKEQCLKKIIIKQLGKTIGYEKQEEHIN